MNKLTNVFVYGTLKSGEPNHYLLVEALKAGTSKFLGSCVSTKNYPLVVASRFNIPYLLRAAGRGEVGRGVEKRRR